MMPGAGGDSIDHLKEASTRELAKIKFPVGSARAPIMKSPSRIPATWQIA